MERKEWERKNCLTENRSCFNCGYYKHFDDELLQPDDESDSDKSFCRAMRNDDVKNYYFGMDHEERTMVCNQWISDGSR